MLPLRLTEIAVKTRAEYERLIAGIDSRSGLTEGATLFACLLLRMRFSKDGSFIGTIRGGAGGADGGYVSTRGKAHRHYWLEVDSLDGGGAFVVDIAAERFGEDPVRVIPIVASVGQYCPGDVAAVQACLEEVRALLTSDFRDAEGDSQPTV